MHMLELHVLNDSAASRGVILLGTHQPLGRVQRLVISQGHEQHLKAAKYHYRGRDPGKGRDFPGLQFRTSTLS
jgi:hypothetical protein